ncbi:CRTAC1 family protein [Arenibacter sp. GZD96]|uniref:CRTAC1 family protein n=1 Tax=Aurantibrevibacter litoralis TaxID=3106030 RepID=UPI002AFFC8A8|nr:CRTAC1 family protein [Arenibacter sp. GZD-96]MEA1786417.1 CRTAC1 family protein [Arenibacter sp. GZD-96]
MRVFVLFLFTPLLLNAQTGFTDITEAAGIDHYFEVYEGLFGGGIAVLDLNNDGYEDFYMTSGMRNDVLYLNNGNGTFTDIHKKAGLGITYNYVTQAVVSADFNRDGWVDLLVTTINSKDNLQQIPRAKNLVFLNNGDYTFRDVTTEYGLDDMYSFSTGANVGDINADGYPDVYIGNYFLEYEGKLSHISDATIVNANNKAKGYLLMNKNGKRFENEYAKYGLTHTGFGFGGLFTDYDNDGDQDLFIVNDFGYKAIPNFVWENLFPKKKFKDVSKELEMDLKINSMGAAVGDYNNDGYLDYFMTNIRVNKFMVNQGPGNAFVDQLKELGLKYIGISWGANFADFDHDGDLDLFVTNGDLNPNCVPMGNFYFENEHGVFKEKGREMGVNDYGLGRGSVILDIDNDGDMDILFINQKAVLEYPVASTTRLLRNDLAKGNWLKVQLKGIEAESNGIGSRVQIVVGNTRMLREIDGGGSSHMSQNSTIAHFGLGTATKVDSVIVTWLGNKKQILLNQEVNQLLTITENQLSPSYLTWYTIVIVLGIALASILIIYFKKSTKRAH